MNKFHFLKEYNEQNNKRKKNVGDYKRETCVIHFINEIVREKIIMFVCYFRNRKRP